MKTVGLVQIEIICIWKTIITLKKEKKKMKCALERIGHIFGEEKIAVTNIFFFSLRCFQRPFFHSILGSRDCVEKV